MTKTASDDDDLGQLLSKALRAVRAIRSARSQDLAAALGLSLRGYQHFESGGGQLNAEHVLRFSIAIDCDPFGVLAAVRIGAPEFAAYTAKNKAMSSFLGELQEFVEEFGEAIALLESATFISAYRKLFKRLAKDVKRAQRDNDAWMAKNAARLGLPRRPSKASGEND